MFCLINILPSAALVAAGRVCALQHKTNAAHALCHSAIQLMSDGPSTCGLTTEQWALCQYKFLLLIQTLCESFFVYSDGKYCPSLLESALLCRS